MRVRRKSEIAFYEAAKEQHETLKKEHRKHVMRVKKDNEREKERHKARKREINEARNSMRTVVRTRLPMAHMTHGMEHQSQTELDKLFQEESIQPLLSASISPPEVIPEPEEPSFQHDEPDVYDVLTVKEQMEFVQGGYALRAMPGSYVLTSMTTGDKFIIQQSDLETRFEEA